MFPDNRIAHLRGVKSIVLNVIALAFFSCKIGPVIHNAHRKLPVFQHINADRRHKIKFQIIALQHLPRLAHKLQGIPLTPARHTDPENVRLYRAICNQRIALCVRPEHIRRITEQTIPLCNAEECIDQLKSADVQPDKRELLIRIRLDNRLRLLKKSYFVVNTCQQIIIRTILCAHAEPFAPDNGIYSPETENIIFRPSCDKIPRPALQTLPLQTLTALRRCHKHRNPPVFSRFPAAIQKP